MVGATVAGGAQQKPPIIDMHMHARMGPALRDSRPAPRPCMPTPCQGAPSVARAQGDPLRLTLEAMNRHNIVLGFLSDSLENVFQWVDAAPNQFIASPTVSDPKQSDLARLRREYKAGRLRGMGELASQYAGIAPNDPSLEPFFALAEEFDVPVLIHTEGIAGASQRFRIAHGHPELLEEVLARHPRLRLYLENAGFPFVDETIALMYRYDNVYVDVSTSTWIVPRPIFYRVLSELFDAGLGTRVMFGSDQMNWPETIDAAVETIETAPFLTPEQKRDVFYNNAARFLRLDKKRTN
jgi:predicted TIM-barrel fold metal-dependent hydrolase